MEKKDRCEIGSCPFAIGGEEMSWGLSPEGWAHAKARHEKHKEESHN
jgi:hypothetical protein